MRRFRLLTPLFALTLASALTLPLAGCGNSDTTTAPVVDARVETTSFAPSLGIDLTASGWTTTSSGLWYRTTTAAPATAAVVTTGQTLSVRYTGYFTDGSSFGTGPFSFVLGSNGAIAGFSVGLAGARIGETRRLLVPPGLAYGPYGNQGIPGNVVLVFDVTVLSAS